MNRYTRSILCSLVAVLLFCQCGSTEDQGGYGKKFPMTEETFATIDSCMEFMNTDPARSHRMLDSVRQAGILSPKRCEYLHAMVVYTGDQQPDSALLMCDRLLADEDFGDDQFLEEEICVLAANLASVCNHQLDVLKYANRGIAICHGQERMRGDEAALMGRVGAAEQMLGRVDDARQTYALPPNCSAKTTLLTDLYPPSLSRRNRLACAVPKRTTTVSSASAMMCSALSGALTVIHPLSNRVHRPCISQAVPHASLQSSMNVKCTHIWLVPIV